MEAPIAAEQLAIVPASEASWGWWPMWIASRAVTCFAVRVGYRGRGLTYPLAAATVGHARERGAQAIEAYPMITQPGKEITWGEVHVGTRQVFEEAGFEEVSRPTLRRVVMRVDLTGANGVDGASADRLRSLACIGF